MSDFKMPYQTYGKNDYEINLEKDTRNRNNPKGSSTSFNLNKDKSPKITPDLRKKPTFDLSKPPSGPPFNPRKKPPSPFRPRNLPRPEIVAPQPGMVPIGNLPFYHTPNKPVDPRDCDRYSNSPWCGGNGFTLTPVGIEYKVVLDNCNIGIQATGVFGFTYLPDFQIVYRSTAPECQPPPPKPPPTPPEFPPLNLPNVDPEAIVYVWINWNVEKNDYYLDFKGRFRDGGYKREWSMSYGMNWTDFECPGRQVIYQTSRGDYPVKYLFGGRYSYAYSYSGTATKFDDSGEERTVEWVESKNINRNISIKADYFPDYEIFDGGAFFIVGGRRRNDFDRTQFATEELTNAHPDIVSILLEISNLGDITLFDEDVYPEYLSIAFYGKWGKLAKSLTEFHRRHNIHGSTNDSIYFESSRTHKYNISIAKVCLTNCSPALAVPPPPPLPLLPPDDMGCSCADIAAIVRSTLKSMKQVIEVPICSCDYNDEEKQWIPTTEYKTIEIFCPNSEQAASISLLYYNQYKLEFNSCIAKNIEKVIGHSDFPITLPKSLLTQREGFLSDITPDEIERMFPEEQVVVENLPRLIIWFIEQFDALLGEWEVPIQVQDIDATQEGDQGVMMRIPNLAEFAGESMGLLLELITDMKTLVSITYRTLMDTGSDKQQNFKSYKMIEALTDYFGFKMVETTAEMPLMFTAGKTKMHEILTESVVNVPIVEFDEKINFQTTVMKIARIEGILNSQFFRQIDPNGDIRKQIMGYLLRSLTSVEDSKEKNNEKEGDDWKKFVNDVQEGFINTPGTTERTNPYGKPYANRPKIRDLGDLTS